MTHFRAKLAFPLLIVLLVSAALAQRATKPVRCSMDEEKMTHDYKCDLNLPTNMTGCMYGTKQFYVFDRSLNNGQCKEVTMCSNIYDSIVFYQKDECERICSKFRNPCNQTYYMGLCDSYEPMWYYDQASETCREGIYSGCCGSGNRFSSKLKCDKICNKNFDSKKASRHSWKANSCYLPPMDQQQKDPDCKTGEFTWWYYDILSNMCMPVKRGFCRPRAKNRFRTLAQCKYLCMDPMDLDDCKQPSPLCKPTGDQFYRRGF